MHVKRPVDALMLAWVIDHLAQPVFRLLGCNMRHLICMPSFPCYKLLLVSVFLDKWLTNTLFSFVLVIGKIYQAVDSADGTNFTLVED